MTPKTSLLYIDRDVERNNQFTDRSLSFEKCAAIERLEFKYENLPSEKWTLIQQLTTEIKEDLQKTVRTIWRIGKKLIEVRSQIETCDFTSWLKTEFNWSRRTAYNYINVYEAFPELNCAKFARLDNVSISALYLLAAPSTHPQIRDRFLDLALTGNNINHQSVRAAINEFKEAQLDLTRTDPARILATDECKDAVLIESMPSTVEAPIVDLSDAKVTINNSELNDIEPEFVNEDAAVSDLRPTWNSIESGFSLFWGNTTSPRFIDCLPEDAFVLAVPCCQWHHDWLSNESRSCFNLTRSKLDKKLVTQLLSVLVVGEKAIIFPWLPNWKIVELALKLKLRVYAGDPDLRKCEDTIAKLGFKLMSN
jgi:Protein of unknown function (DUF3102)